MAKYREGENFDGEDLDFGKKLDNLIEESELQGGIYFDKLPVGNSLKIQTQNTIYILEKREDGYYISGHAEYCPEPTKIRSLGGTWSGQLFKPGFVARGMQLEGFLEGYPRWTTSRIVEIEEIQK